MYPTFRLFCFYINCILVLISTLGNFCQAQDNLEVSERINSLFSKYTPDTPGVAVGIVKNGEILFSKGFGSANLEYNVPITPKTVFHVASVSKQFTAFAIYLLKDQGLINLDDDIRKYITELPHYGATISIKHLLAHTSGLRDQWALLTLAGWHLEDVITTEQILKLAIQQKELNFEPGTAFSYCNTSYTLLGELVERVTQKSLHEFASENIFKPLGMLNTQFYDDYHNIVKNRAYSYELQNNNYLKKKLNYSNIGPTSLFTTVEDLVKWSNNFENPVVGNKKLIEEFNQVSTLDNGNPVIFRTIKKDTLFHAKGQILRNHRGINMIKHGGHDAGFRSFLARFPNEKMSIITLSNDEHYEIFARGLEIAEFYLKNKMDKINIEYKTTSVKKDETIKFESTLKSFIGNYSSNELSTTYHFRLENETLIISHKRLPDMPLVQIGENKFSGNNYFNFEITFSKDSLGEIKGFTISNFGVRDLIFNKI